VHPMQDHQRRAMARFEQSQQQLRQEADQAEHRT